MDKTGSLDIKWIQGFPDKNVEFVDDKTVCYSLGNHVCFLNLETKLRHVFQSPGYGVGALTANSKSSIFAFSEQKLSPSIFVYSFPEPQLKNELKGDAQLDYTSLALCDTGPYLGGCSSFPDYTITVWNWENAEVICTQSQAGQDVISLLFNPLDWFQLCALGTATLTVWSIDKSPSLSVLKPRVIELPATDGSFPDNSSDDTLQSTRVTVTPTAVCWTATSELYVGCEEGYLLRVDPESYSVLILFNPTSADAIPELQKFHFQALRLTKNGVIAAGKGSVVHRLHIKETQTNIKQTWQLERPVTTVLLSPDTETLLLSSSTGQIYLLNPSQSNQIVKVLDVSSGDFLAASLLHVNRNTCVSLRENGVLQLWSSDGTLLSSLPLQVEVTSLACCPVAYYAAVGTASGSVLFIDLNAEERPRLVHQAYLFHTAVNLVVFDQQGHYLLISDSDSHLCVINAKPSAKFTVIGYMVLSGPILSLSTFQSFGRSDEVNVLALCSEQRGSAEDGQLLTVFFLPLEGTTDCVDRHGVLSAHKLRLLTYKVPLPLTSCTLGDREVFAYCQRNKSLQRFELPESDDGLSIQQVVQLKPVQKVKGHPLGPASVFLSPDYLWLASLGRDGSLCIRQTASMERYTELLCHSRHRGRERSVSLSTDGHTLLTTGCSDGCVVCTDLRIKDVDDEKPVNASLYNDTVAPMLKIVFTAENPVLINLPEWGPVSPDSEKTEESQVSGASLDEAGKDASPSNLTWLERRREAVVKEDVEQYSEAKERLRETVGELHDTIQKMLEENESLPPDQFSLDLEERRRLEEKMEQEVETMRADIQWDIAEKCYLCDVLKRESWDSWMVKRRALKAFHSEQVIWNYPVKERTEKELEELRRVQNIRKLEEAACSLGSVTKSSSVQEEKEDKGHESENAALTGSISAQIGFSNPYICDQFSLQTTDQRISQIILLQDLIYCIKMSFNAEFEALHSQKVQELKRVRSRNSQTRDIMLELDMNQELWEPSLTDGERPERLLTVDHSEIKAERFLPSAHAERERRRKLEEELNLAHQRGDGKDRALYGMMYGALTVKRSDILNKEIPQPEFVLTKAVTDWSEEENIVYKEYMKNTKDLNEEKEKCKQSLEAEMKKLQESIKESTVMFDEALMKLVKKKFTYTTAIYQEELRICHLVHSVFTEDKMRHQEQDLKLKLEKTLEHKNETWEEVTRHQHEVDLFKEDYEYSLAIDKSSERDFRVAFKDVPHHLVDELYKLFKRRPRVQKMRAQTENLSSVFKEHLPPQAPDSLSQMQKALEELDAPEHMPDGLNPIVWEKFCQMRRRNVKNEQEMRRNASTLAEMQAFLQRRKKEDVAAQEEFEKLSEALESLYKKRNKHLMNTTVQVRLKQGQVEVSTPDLTEDNTDNDIILCHRSVKDTRRETIKTLARRKVASMKKHKKIRKDTIQLEWEQRVINKKTEDLKDKMRDIKMLRLSKEQKDMKFCSKKEQKHHMTEQISNLETSIDLMKKTFQRSVQQQLNKVERLNTKTKEKAKNSSSLQQQILDLQTTVAALTNIKGATVSDTDKKAEREARYQEIVQMCNLEDTAQAMSEELTLLQKEVNRLRRKNFPCFD